LFEHLDPMHFSVSTNCVDSLAPPLALASHLIESGARTALITMGELGVLYHDANQTKVSPAFQVKPIDTTGAGDVFHGAYIYALLQDWDIDKALRFANVAAALSCRKLSGSGGIPSLEEVMLILDDDAV